MIEDKAGLARIAIAFVFGAALCVIAMAQASANPFGIGDASVPLRSPALDGFSGWLLSNQAEFHRLLVKALREARAEGNVQFTLVVLSFAYGVFHAAGPGHGKAVITSYLLANEQAWRRGIGLSLASALLQASVAILVVAIGSLVLDLTARSMSTVIRFIEVMGFLTVASIGLYLVWTKAGAFLRDLQGAFRPVGLVVAGASDPLSLDRILQSQSSLENRGKSGCLCTHSPAMLAQAKGWRTGVAAAIGAGLRPCTGAIVVLVFAWSQDIVAAGIAAVLAMAVGTAITVAVIATLAVKAKSIALHLMAKSDGLGMLMVRGVEMAAAISLLGLGLLLLTGNLAAETTLGG
jgi:nickel/cobalt exporter